MVKGLSDVIRPPVCGKRLPSEMIKNQREEGRRTHGKTPTSSMSNESAFSARSWVSKGGASLEGAFSGVEVRSVSSLAT